VTSITTDKTVSSSSETKLLDKAIFAMIDSTIPHFYLPQSTCKAFESAFGLTWNTTSELYTLNGTQHEALTKLNPSVTFTLSPQIPAKATDQSVSITLPYSAFDLTVSWPYVDSSTAYFPLKRATNETQFTLGRAFFQEAYVIADYERQNFSVWPCKWDSETSSAKVLPILSIDASVNSTDTTASPGTSTSNPSEKEISTGAIAGIAVGAALVVIGLAIAAWYFCIKKPQGPKRISLELEAQERSVEMDQDALPRYFPGKKGHAELDSRQRHELPDHETKFGIIEAPSEHPKFEMEGTGTPTELEAGVGKGNARRIVYEMDTQQMPGKLDLCVKLEGQAAQSVRRGEKEGSCFSEQGNGWR
jgi:hypothetical protein